LFDPDDGKGEPTFPVSAFTIIASSPNNANYKGFDKALATETRGSRKRYFPCWALDELVACNRLLPAATKERFEMWGGIPRYVFDGDQEKLHDSLRTYLDAISIDVIHRYIRTPEIRPNDQELLSHMLVQYRVDAPHSKGELDFSSAIIGRKIIEELLRRDVQQLVAHYRWCLQEEWKGVYVGHVWEHLCHYLLPEGNLELDPLEPAVKKKKNVLTNGAILVDVGDAQTMEGIVAAGKYFKPSTPNFPVIDAAAMDGNIVYGFQMTLAKRHPPKGEHLVTILEALPPNVDFALVWVVDPAKDKNGFRKQVIDISNVKDAKHMTMLQKVKQWRLSLTFPQTSEFAKILSKYKKL
jgi:hypothetical protein